jgi:4-amino-4-deoxy-L-arabinose transferase-like glycosyltransferase
MLKPISTHYLVLPSMEQVTTYRYSNNQVYILFVVVVFVLFFKLNAPPIYILDEARNAQAGREMFHSKDYIVPTFNGELRSHKPVLHYWFMQPAYALFGETAFAARFFSAVMGVLTILITFLYTRKWLGESVAFCTALALALSTHFLFEFRLAVPDPYLICFSTLGTFAAFTYLQKGIRSQLFLAAIAFALASLAKGPVAIGLPGLSMLIWVIWKKKWNRVFDWSIIVAAIIFFAVALPWYIAVHKATNGQWTREFFFTHNFNRFAEEMEGHGGIFLITIAIIVIGMLPFTTFIGEIIKKRKTFFKHEMVQFAAVITSVFTVFYCISSTKLPNYPMPCYPFFALVFGYFISELISHKTTSKKYPIYILLLIMTAVPVAGYFAIQQEIEAKQISWVALTMLIAPWMMLCFMIFNKNIDWFKRILIIAVPYTFFNILLLHVVYPKLYEKNPVSKTIRIAKNHQHIYAYQIYNPGYNFYLNTNIKEYPSLDSIKARLQQYPDALIISRKEFTDSLKTLNLQVVAQHHDIFELPTTILLTSNAKNP